MSTIEDIERLIAKGKLEQAIKTLLQLSANASSELKNDIILQSGRLNRTEADFKRGIIPITHLQLIRNNVAFAVIGYLDEFKENTSSNLQPKEKAIEKSEIKELLKLFERAVFEASIHSEEATAMFDAIQNVRIGLQMKNAGLIENERAAKLFREIWKDLLAIEGQVIEKYPNIFAALAELKSQPMDWERRKRAEEIIGKDDYWQAIGLMMSIRDKINPKVEEIREIYRGFAT